jgi:hypothetical protein
MSGIPINLDREKFNFLLQKLEQGMFDRDAVRELKPLLQAEIEEARRKGKFDRADDLSLLMDILNSYASGKINLMPEINVNVNVA